MKAYTFTLRKKGVFGTAVLWQEQETGTGMWVIDGAKAGGTMMVKDLQRSFKTEAEAREVLINEGYKYDGEINEST